MRAVVLDPCSKAASINSLCIFDKYVGHLPYYRECSRRHWLHDLGHPMQNENVRSLVQSLLRIYR